MRMIGGGHILSLLFEPDSKANRMLRIPAATFVFSDLLNIVEPVNPVAFLSRHLWVCSIHGGETSRSDAYHLLTAKANNSLQFARPLQRAQWLNCRAQELLASR